MLHVQGLSELILLVESVSSIQEESFGGNEGDERYNELPDIEYEADYHKYFDFILSIGYFNTQYYRSLIIGITRSHCFLVFIKFIHFEGEEVGTREEED